MRGLLFAIVLLGCTHARVVARAVVRPAAAKRAVEPAIVVVAASPPDEPEEEPFHRDRAPVCCIAFAQQPKAMVLTEVASADVQSIPFNSAAFADAVENVWPECCAEARQASSISAKDDLVVARLRSTRARLASDPLMPAAERAFYLWAEYDAAVSEFQHALVGAVRAPLARAILARPRVVALLERAVTTRWGELLDRSDLVAMEGPRMLSREPVLFESIVDRCVAATIDAKRPRWLAVVKGD